MKYEVILPFSHKFNEKRIELSVGDTISDKEINPSILTFVLGRKKIKPLQKKVSVKVKESKIESKKRAVKRVIKEEVKEIVEPEEVKEERKAELFELNEKSLKEKSKSELKRLATQLGLGISGSAKTLRGRILKSGV